MASGKPRPSVRPTAAPSKKGDQPTPSSASRHHSAYGRLRAESASEPVSDPAGYYADGPPPPPMTRPAPPPQPSGRRQRKGKGRGKPQEETAQTEPKLFVRGLSADVTEDVVRDYFSEFGEVQSCDVKVMKDGKCFAFVTFTEMEACDSVLRAQEEDADFKHIIDGQEAIVHRDRKTTQSSPGNSRSTGNSGAPPPILPPQQFAQRQSSLAPAGPTGFDICNRIFVGDLSEETTAEMLTEYFAQFAESSDARIVTDPTTGKSRGFGYITLANPDALEEVLGLQDDGQAHEIDGAEVKIKRHNQKAPTTSQPSRAAAASSSSAQGRGAAPVNTTKIFVGGLPQDCTEEAVLDYFQTYGNIIDVKVMIDEKTGRSRGFGFVRFEDTAVVGMVLSEAAKHTIQGKWVEVKPADGKRPAHGNADGQSQQKKPKRERERGPDDWDCPACGTHNFNYRKTCFNCKMPKPEESI